MYTPKQFIVNDEAEIISFIKENPFGALVSYASEDFYATHIPFMISQKNDKWYLHAHLANANEHCKALALKKEVLIIFQGAHHYVSSAWYGHANVPTWNYLIAQVKGNVRLLSATELMEVMKDLMQTYEPAETSNVSWDKLPKKMLDANLKDITGIEIEITAIEASFKLSQNRNTQDHQHIIDKLNELDSTNAKHVAEAMRRTKK